MSIGAGARVLDSWALLAFLNDEPAADRVREIILRAQRAGEELLVTVVNMAEVWYNLARRTSDTKADEAVANLLKLGVVLVEVDWELARQAGRFKSKHHISLGDSFAAALAKLRDIEVVTGDSEFRQLEPEVKVHWIGLR